jgi:hypothetical protein
MNGKIKVYFLRGEIEVCRGLGKSPWMLRKTTQKITNGKNKMPKKVAKISKSSPKSAIFIY